MKKKITKIVVIISIATTSIFTFGFSDSYFEVSKNLDIFATLFRELNITNNKINKHLNTYSPQKIENTFNELTNSLRSLKESNQLINKEKEHYQLTIEKMQLQLERADRRNTLIMELMSIKGGWGTKDSTRLKAIEQELIQYAR